jgi:hypothetical protein
MTATKGMITGFMFRVGRGTASRCNRTERGWYCVATRGFINDTRTHLSAHMTKLVDDL